MAYFAVLDENNIITNLIVADSLQIAESVTGTTCIEYFLPMIGGTYVDGQFVDPILEEIPSEDPVVPEEPSNP
jgi:hypothetical protein